MNFKTCWKARQNCHMTTVCLSAQGVDDIALMQNSVFLIKSLFEEVFSVEFTSKSNSWFISQYHKSMKCGLNIGLIDKTLTSY